jgi:hypothetical protein
MKTACFAGGLLCASVLSGTAWADCHDAHKSHFRLRNPANPGAALLCRAVVDLYAASWSTGDFTATLDDPVELTVELSPRQIVQGKAAVAQRLKEDAAQLGSGVRYTILDDDVNGHHLKVGGFLFFGGVHLSNTAELSWKGRIEGSNGRTTEQGRAIAVRTGADPQRPWQFVALFIKREPVRRR